MLQVNLNTNFGQWAYKRVMHDVMQQYVFILGFTFWVHILNHEFKLQITMRTGVTWKRLLLHSHVTHIEMY